MSIQSLNKSKGGSLAWAWRLIDRHRAGASIKQHQIDFALEGIEKALGRRPCHGTMFDGEEHLRKRVVPR